MTNDDLLNALRVCFDPELPVNIVDLGLVYAASLAPDRDAPGPEPRFHAHIQLTMRAPDEQREAMLVAQVSNRLAGMEQISGSTVQMVWQPPWTAERMTPAARRQLGLDPRSAPAQPLVQIELAKGPLRRR